MGVDSTGRGLAGMIRVRDAFDNGGIANARVVRTYSDIETARENGDHAVMFYVQRRPEDSDWQLDGDVGKLRRWYNEGLRILQVSYGHNPPSRPDAHTPDERLGYGSREGDEKGVHELGHETGRMVRRQQIVQSGRQEPHLFPVQCRGAASPHHLSRVIPQCTPSHSC